MKGPLQPMGYTISYKIILISFIYLFWVLFKKLNFSGVL